VCLVSRGPLPQPLAFGARGGGGGAPRRTTRVAGSPCFLGQPAAAQAAGADGAQSAGAEVHTEHTQCGSGRSAHGAHPVRVLSKLLYA
jgi:hypothetical protein